MYKNRKKFRSVDKFGRLVPGSDLVKFPIDRLVIASPPRPLVGFSFRSWSECSTRCLVVQVQNKTKKKKKKKKKKNDLSKKHGHRRPSLFFFQSHLFRNYWVDSNETCLLGSSQCLVVQAPNQILVGRHISYFWLPARQKIVRIPSKRQNIDHLCSGTKCISAVQLRIWLQIRLSFIYWKYE